MLICKFATARSSRERILGWIHYLEDRTRQVELDAETRRTLEQLLDEARLWAAGTTAA